RKSGLQQFRLDLVNRTAQRQGKGMVVEEIRLGDTKIDYTHQNDELIIHLPVASVEGKALTFRLKYHGVPFDGLRIGPTKYGDRSFFCENWPNKARHWLPTYDHPSDKATVEFIVKAPSHYKVISNGLLQEESDLGKQMKLTHWKQSVPVSCWLFVLGVAEFAVQYVDQFEGKSIQTWVYPQNREAGFYDFHEPTKKVLEFYTQYVGPYVYEKLANIQCASVSGGMETSSAIFYAENLVNGKRDERTRNVVIHEIAHQWFGNAVTESTWDDVWLSEGFATFFTLLFIEQAYGKEEYTKGLLKAKKTVFDLAAKMPDHSVVSPRSAEKEEVTTGLTYQKGAWVLHMLRNLVGEDAFQKGIRSYYARFMNANATTDDFRKEMELASGLDLFTFFQQWLYQPVNPSLQVSWKYNSRKKNLVVDIEQVQNGNIIFQAPVEMAYYQKGVTQPLLLKVALKGKKQRESFTVEGEVERVEVDPGNIFLGNIILK
ncbi:MAG: M1 family metallopeptidase, partial [Chitinophagaceae bacterium]